MNDTNQIREEGHHMGVDYGINTRRSDVIEGVCVTVVFLVVMAIIGLYFYL